MLSILNASMDRGWIVTIIYQKGTEITKRNIKVLEITEENITAFCFLRNQKRIFKIDNILAASYCKRNERLKLAGNL